MGHIGFGKLYEVFKNWKVDITRDFKVGKAEQMFHMDKQVEVKTMHLHLYYVESLCLTIF